MCYCSGNPPASSAKEKDFPHDTWPDSLSDHAVCGCRYWVHQCIEVVDASQRQLKQFVLISPAVNYLSVDEGSQCSAAVSRQQAPLNPQLLAAFNDAASRIEACAAPLSELSARAFDKPHKATWHYNRSRKVSPQKVVITVENAPIL